MSCKYLIVLIIVFIFSLSETTLAMTENKELRVAILDNFTAEKFSQKYKDAYFAGIKTAVSAAEENGFPIVYKAFSYKNNPLDILNSLPEVEAWKPDVIIGPHLSNQFLLLKGRIKDILVISPYATDEAITKMPSNFYSLSLPDNYMASANLMFIDKYYRKKNIFNVSQADCKDCMDTTLIFNKMYKEKFPDTIIKNGFYTGNDLKSIKIDKIMSNYTPDSIIILQPLNYTDAYKLMLEISSYLKMKNLVFIYNVDNWGNSKEAKKMIDKNIEDFTSFRISSFILDEKSKIYSKFLIYYKRKINIFPINTVSFMSYASVMSVIDSLKSFPSNPKKTMHEQVLSSYTLARNSDPNWYRSKTCVAYKLETDGEKEFSSISTF